jgi:hypothetical protein
VLPARELLADLLLELKQPAAALVEYRAMLSTDPPLPQLCRRGPRRESDGCQVFRWARHFNRVDWRAA